MRKSDNIPSLWMELRAPNPAHGLAALVCSPMPVLCLAQDQVSEKSFLLLSDTISSFCCQLRVAKMSPKPTCLAGQDLTGALGHFPQAHVHCALQLVTDSCQAQENGVQWELTPQNSLQNWGIRESQVVLKAGTNKAQGTPRKPVVLISHHCPRWPLSD